MSRFLSIVIPSYRETALEIYPLLSSIAGQRGVDMDAIEAILVRDGTEAIDESLFGLFPFRCRQIVLPENGGTGLARQAGIDAAEGTYIMCCDADDQLQNCMALGQMMNAAATERPDILRTAWTEEILRPDGAWVYLPQDDDTSWMHGKLLRRAFLEAHNIRFHPELRWNEETYFLQLCDSWSEKSWRLPITSYLWKWGPDSITRRNNSVYSFECVPSFVKASALSHREIATFRPEHLLYKVTQSLLYLYFSLHTPEWAKEEHAGHLQDAEDAIKEWYPQTWHYFSTADPGFVARIYNEERGKHFAGCVETETLDEWIARLGLPPRKQNAGTCARTNRGCDT